MSSPITLETILLLDEASKNEEVSAVLFDKYFQFLESYANSQMSDKLKRREGADDIALTVCKSFLMKVEAGAVQFESSKDVWKHLAFKVRQRIARRAEFHSAEKRAMGREVNSSTVMAPASAPSANDPFEDAAFRDEMAHVVNTVVPRCSEIVSLSANACSIAEIADILNVEEDHVRRALVMRYRNSMTEIALAECIERSCPTVRRIAARLEEDVRQVLHSSK